LNEAAERLGLHPASLRAMAARGAVSAEKVAGRWLMDNAEVRRLEASHIAQGRPWSARSVWALLEAAGGGQPAGLSRSELRRLHERLGQLAEISPGRLAGRAVVHHMHGHPRSLERLAADQRVVVSGVAAVAGRSPDLVSDDAASVYVPADLFDAVVTAHRLVPVPVSGANVEVRVPVGGWPFEGGVVLWPVAAADLLDRGDERSVRAARALFADAAIVGSQ
jgi:hypothetical protein